MGNDDQGLLATIINGFRADIQSLRNDLKEDLNKGMDRIEKYHVANSNMLAVVQQWIDQRRVAIDAIIADKDDKTKRFKDFTWHVLSAAAVAIVTIYLLPEILKALWHIGSSS